MSFLRPVLALMWKDILLELRTKDIVISVLVFSLVSIVIFNFAFEPTPRVVGLVAPGVLWVAILFGCVIGLTRSFAVEKDRGNLIGLLLAPVSRDTIYFGKMFANFIFMVIVELAIFPVFIALYNLEHLTAQLIPVALLATLGISTIGTVFSAMAVNTRSREVMLPILFFPVAVPIIIAAVEASGLLFRDENVSDLWRWLGFLAAFDAVFLVICPVAFSAVIED